MARRFIYKSSLLRCRLWKALCFRNLLTRGRWTLGFSCYEEIQKIQAAIHAGYTPNADVVVRSISSGVQQREMQLRAYAHKCVQPGLDYFDRQLCTNLQEPLAVFKTTQLFSPHRVQVLQPTASDIDSLSIIPFLNNDSILSGLTEEHPAYIAKCNEIGSVSDIDWWRMNSEHLPKWSACVRQILLIQPSSAAAERVFSLLTSSFTEQQIHSLNDYIETSIMLQYNEHQN